MIYIMQSMLKNIVFAAEHMETAHKDAVIYMALSSCFQDCVLSGISLRGIPGSQWYNQTEWKVNHV